MAIHMWRRFLVGGALPRDLWERATRELALTDLSGAHQLCTQSWRPRYGQEVIETVICTITDLGFPKGAVAERVFNDLRLARQSVRLVRKKELPHGARIALLPSDVLVQLRLAYRDQPYGEFVTLGTSLLRGRCCGYRLASLKRYQPGAGDYLCPTHALETIPIRRADQVNPHALFVFQLFRP